MSQIDETNPARFVEGDPVKFYGMDYTIYRDGVITNWDGKPTWVYVVIDEKTDRSIHNVLESELEPR